MYDFIVIGNERSKIDELVSELKSRGAKAVGYTVRQIKNGKDGLRFKKILIVGEVIVDEEMLSALHYLRVIQAKFKLD